jgi:hypothetical protein
MSTGINSEVTNFEHFAHAFQYQTLARFTC